MYIIVNSKIRMNRIYKKGYFAIGFASILLLWLANCKPQSTMVVPFVKTNAVKNITASSVNTGGEVVDDGGDSVTSRGVCWSLKHNPTTNYKDSITTDGTGIGKFNSTVTKLNPGNTYYFRAYARNGIGIAYGNEQTTTLPPVLPTVTTAPVTAVTDKIIFSGGTVTFDGGSPVSGRGICWGTKPNPTLADTFTSDGIGTGSFISSVSKIAPDSAYYLRAYATNSVGTAYGASRLFSIKGLIVIDKDGNFYHSVPIGSQVWLIENLKTTRYSDNTEIPLVEDNTPWSNLQSHGYCWYNNDSTVNKASYGALYNWYAVSTGKLCPTGYHVPTDADWTTLTTHLGGEIGAGGMLKESTLDYWKTPNTGATNETLFTALPGGNRTEAGESLTLGSYGYWWSSTSVNQTVAYNRYMYYGSKAVTRSFVSKQYGLSVRCIKN